MMSDILKSLLVKYHSKRASEEADLAFYAVTLDFKNQDLPLADLFSGLLCKEQLKWQNLLLIFAVYNMFSVPFAICVSRGDWPENETGENMLELVEKIGDVLFILEVFFNFYLPYEEEGVLINIHTLIHRNYLRGWFGLDVIGAIPLELPLFLMEGNSTSTRLLRLNKLVRFFRLNFYWGRMEKGLLEINPSLIRLGKFIFLFFLSAHWVACLWLEVVRNEDDEDVKKWVGVHDFNDPVRWALWDRYFQAFYWALVTMVGYGGTIPQTFLESFFSFCVVTVGVGMYIVVIGTVGTIVLNLDTSENKHRQHMESMNDFLRLKKIPRYLVNKVHSYYDFLWRSRQGSESVATENDLPMYLKVEIAMYICKDLMAKVPFFKQASDHFFRQLCTLLYPLVCLPDTRIVMKGEMGKEMYFIVKGSLEVIAEHVEENGDVKERTLCIMEQGQYFGELALMCKSKRTVTIRSREFCDLLVLNADDFRVCLQTGHRVQILT